MSHLGLNEREIERVLAGHQPHGRQDLAEVAYFFARLRTMGDFEQPPPMSPKLLAQLDAAEVARRDDELARQRAQRARQARRRWRLVGAAAAVTLLGGLFVMSSRDATEAPQTETDGDPADRPKGETTATTAPATLPPATTAPTVPPTTAPPPPPPEPETTSTAPPVEADTESDGPESEGGPHPWPPPDGPSQGDEGYDEFIEHWGEHCERNPHDDYCDWYRRYVEPYRGP